MVELTLRNFHSVRGSLRINSLDKFDTNSFMAFFHLGEGHSHPVSNLNITGLLFKVQIMFQMPHVLVSAENFIKTTKK